MDLTVIEKNSIIKIKRRLTVIIRKEMKKEQFRYDKICKLLFNIIEKNPSYENTNKEQIKIDRGKEIWELVYASYYNRLEKIIKTINEINEA